MLKNRAGIPQPGVRVDFERGPLTSYSDFTDAEGRFELRALPAGAVTVMARIPGEGRATATVSGEPSETKTCELVPDPGTWMRGRLIDEAGFEATFHVDPFRRQCLLEGLDDIGLTLRHVEEIQAFEDARALAE